MKSNPKLIGEGRTRVVYDIGNSKVLKVAKNLDGITGNITEDKLSKIEDTHVPRVFDSDLEHKWIIVEKIKPITDEKLSKLLRLKAEVDYPNIMNTLAAGSKGIIPSHSRPIGNIKELKSQHNQLMKNSWYNKFYNFLVNAQMDPYELHAVNLGLRKNEIVVTDLGPSKGTDKTSKIYLEKAISQTAKHFGISKNEVRRIIKK